MCSGIPPNHRLRVMTTGMSHQGHFIFSRLHPWWTEAAITTHRSFDGYRRAATAVLVILTLIATVALARDSFAARWLYEQRNMEAIGIIAVVFVSLRLPFVTLARSLRNGWMATLPLHGDRNVLIMATAAAGTILFAWLTVGLAGIGVGIGLDAYLRLLGTLGVGVAISCFALAGIAVRALRRPPAPLVRTGSRIPLLSLSWLEDARLPHLVAWQNRECTRRWRTSVGAKPVAILLLFFPGSSGPGPLCILLTIVLLVTWYRCVLHSSYAVVVLAVPVTRPWPLAPGCVVRALMRFPLAAGALCFSLLFVVFLTMQPLGAAVGCALLALALAAPVTLVRLLARLRTLPQ